MNVVGLALGSWELCEPSTLEAGKSRLKEANVLEFERYDRNIVEYGNKIEKNRLNCT